MLKPTFLLLLVFTACQISDEEKAENTSKKSYRIAELAPSKEAKKETLFGITDSLSNFSFNEEYLFGKFYNDRIEFHIIDQPGMKLFNSDVNRLNLYFLAWYLCKKKYELSADISNNLIVRHGKFKVQPLNWTTKNFVTTYTELILNQKEKTLSDSLSNYQLSWIIKRKNVKYIVEKKPNSSSFHYIEAFPKFKSLYKAVAFGII
jgi:hypothetical protein